MRERKQFVPEILIGNNFRNFLWRAGYELIVIAWARLNASIEIIAGAIPYVHTSIQRKMTTLLI